MIKFGIFTALLLVPFLLLSSPAFAADTLPYFNPNSGCVNYMSSGEVFSTRGEAVPYNGQSGFVIQKSADPRWYERFGYDGNYLYHYEDTTWATGNGQNVKCLGTNDEATTMYYRTQFGSSRNTAAEAPSHQADMGTIWAGRDMSAGQCVNSEGTIVGINKRTGEFCDTEYTGPFTRQVCAVESGPVCLPTGLSSANGLVLSVVSGPGAGENYVYDSKAGWIGFNGNYATQSNCLTKGEIDGCYKITNFTPYDQNRCSGSNEGFFRPNGYTVCKVLPVPQPIGSYASSFKVFTTKSRSIDEIVASPECEGNYYPQYSWSAILHEEFNITRLPQAGFGNSDKTPLPEANYLADYLEGTAYYDGKQPAFHRPTYPNPPAVTDFSKRDLWQQAGVFRKLAPSWYQDELKCDMITAAKNGTGPNYKVELEYTPEDKNLFQRGWDIIIDLTGLNQKDLADISCRPKNLSDLDRFLWEKVHFRETHLWPAVPMFTREDAPGTVTLTAQSPGSLSDNSGDGVGTGSVTHPLSVPHVARLNDISQTTYNMIMPSALQSTAIAENVTSPSPLIAAPINDPDHKIKSSIAQNTTNPLPDPDLLAADWNCSSPFSVNIDNVSYDGTQLNYAVQFTNTPDEGGLQCHLYVNDLFWGGCIKPGGTRLDSGASGGLVNPVPAGPNGTYTISASGKLDQHKPCGFTGTIGASCQVTLKAGKVVATTCGPVDNTLPVCGANGPFTADKEDPSAVKDYKDPDRLNAIRKNPASQKLTVTNANPDSGMNSGSANQMYNECHDPNPLTRRYDCSEDFTYSTGIKVSLNLPYLDAIWRQLARDKNSGLFNAFTSGGISGFPKVNSKSDVNYYASKSGFLGLAGDDVSVEPPNGNVYFPYLQGIFDAQNCLSQRLLLPANYAGSAPCP